MTRIFITALTILLASAPAAFAASHVSPRYDRSNEYQALDRRQAPSFDGGTVLHGHDDGSHDTATGGPSGGIY